MGNISVNFSTYLAKGKLKNCFAYLTCDQAFISKRKEGGENRTHEALKCSVFLSCNRFFGFINVESITIPATRFEDYIHFIASG